MNRRLRNAVLIVLCITVVPVISTGAIAITRVRKEKALFADFRAIVARPGARDLRTDSSTRFFCLQECVMVAMSVESDLTPAEAVELVGERARGRGLVFGAATCGRLEVQSAGANIVSCIRDTSDLRVRLMASTGDGLTASKVTLSTFQ